MVGPHDSMKSDADNVKKKQLFKSSSPRPMNSGQTTENCNPPTPSITQLNPKVNGNGTVTGNTLAACLQEGDNAIRQMEALELLLENPIKPTTESSLQECSGIVVEMGRSLVDGMKGISYHAKELEHERFVEALLGVGGSIRGLIEAAAQAAYLVGVSDSSSVDRAYFSRADFVMQYACKELINPRTNQKQVEITMSRIATYSRSVYNACWAESSKTANLEVQRQFQTSAQDIVDGHANLAKEIEERSSDNRDAWLLATRPLLETVAGLRAYVNSPEVSSQPAGISISACAAQEPVTSAGLAIIKVSCQMVRTCKSLAAHPRHPPFWNAMAFHCDNLLDCIKDLVASMKRIKTTSRRGPFTNRMSSSNKKPEETFKKAEEHHTTRDTTEISTSTTQRLEGVSFNLVKDRYASRLPREEVHSPTACQAPTRNQKKRSRRQKSTILQLIRQKSVRAQHHG